MNYRMQACAVLGISPAATSLRRWTAAGLKGKHEAIFGDAEHCTINLIFLNKLRHYIQSNNISMIINKIDNLMKTNNTTPKRDKCKTFSISREVYSIVSY